MTKDEIMLQEMYILYTNSCGVGTPEARAANNLLGRCAAALSRRTEKKPREMTCPGCGGEIKFMPMNKEAHPITYCWLCGQAIDWREEK